MFYHQNIKWKRKSFGIKRKETIQIGPVQWGRITDPEYNHGLHRSNGKAFKNRKLTTLPPTPILDGYFAKAFQKTVRNNFSTLTS